MYSNLLTKNAVHDLAVVQETLGRFENLKLSMKKLLKSLDVDLSRWKKYESAHSDLVLRLSQFDAKLTQLQHLDKSNEEPEKLFEEKLQKLSVSIVLLICVQLHVSKAKWFSWSFWEILTSLL